MKMMESVLYEIDLCEEKIEILIDANNECGRIVINCGETIMNKSKEYKALVEEVKELYRSNPFSNEKIKLGWCDLKENEDLCYEINLWTYW